MSPPLTTYASWINQVERFFGIMTRKAIRGGSFPKVGDLTGKVNALALSILAKIQRLGTYISGTIH